MADDDLPPIYTHPTSRRKDPRDFSSKNNTKLSDKDEAAYQTWAKENGREKDVYDYDMRGAWKEGAGQAENGHLPDTYKKPNHPTFSDESKYHSEDVPGGKWSKKDGKDVYVPSKTNLKHYPAEELQGYFQRVEPDAALELPEE